MRKTTIINKVINLLNKNFVFVENIPNVKQVPLCNEGSNVLMVWDINETETIKVIVEKHKPF